MRNVTVEPESNIKKMFILTGIICLLIFIIKTRYGYFMMSNSSLENFSIIFISIMLEALPFVMIGTIISSLIDIFISENTIERIIPRNKFAALLAASLMGLIFPVCECAIVPITRRLIKKGVPVYIAITFMLAVPIVNPVVLLSTHYAFSGMEYMVLLRGGVGLVCAWVIGYCVSAFTKKGENPLRRGTGYQCHCGCSHHNHEHHSHGHCCQSEHNDLHNESRMYIHKHNHGHVKKQSFLSKLCNVIDHTSMEIYDVGKFFMIGALLSAFFKIYVPKNLMLSIGENPVYSVLGMMILAFVLSICSEADAFVAKTFVGQFTSGSILGFLILGPMIDVKNILMLLGSFKTKFVAKLVFFIFGVCFIAAMMVNIFIISV